MTEIPTDITAIAISTPGGPEVLTPEKRHMPVPGPGEILVKVAAAGVNRPDVFQRRGAYPPPKGASDIPGLELSGEVVELGEGVLLHKTGDLVCALVPGGGYATYAIVHETNALPIPHGLSLVEAALIPETFFTVWSNVFDRAKLKAGETILIHGGSSGIGVTAIQLAKAFGARVIITAGDEAKCRACRDLGADVAINYKTEDFVEVVRSVTEGHGADVILDMVGGDYVERNHIAAAVEGRIVQIATLNGARATIDVSRIMMKRLVHTGSTLRARDVAFKARIAEALREHVWPLLESHKVRIIVDSTFPLEKAADAHARMEGSSHIGKIALVVED
jgi:NADPH2:quinone reductase